MKRVFVAVGMLALASVLFVASCFMENETASAPTDPNLTVQVVAKGLDHPWGMAFLPDGRILVTERSGSLRLVSKDGSISNPIAGVPKVFNKGQGGLLDVALDPNFDRNRLIYLSYAQPAGGRQNRTAVARGRLGNAMITNLHVIFEQQPAIKSSHHFGSRLVFARDGTLFITLGERFSQRDMAQMLDNHIGKIIRINPDGSVPADNPFIDHPNALPEIWSYGHRNSQGAALHPVTGDVWTHEHGPRGGDEINILQAGANYGWPLVSFGSHYSGIPIPESSTRKDIIYPLYHWTPSIAPSGMMFYSGNKFPMWQGNLFVGALAGSHISRLVIEGKKVVTEEKILANMDRRFRDVEQGPDGYIYVLTDHDNGEILRIMP